MEPPSIEALFLGKPGHKWQGNTIAKWEIEAKNKQFWIWSSEAILDHNILPAKILEQKMLKKPKLRLEREEDHRLKGAGIKLVSHYHLLERNLKDIGGEAYDLGGCLL